MKLFIQLSASLAALLLSIPGLAQDPPATKAEFYRVYQNRIRQETLNGVYIPKDIDDAFTTLTGLIDPDSRQKFKTMPEEAAATKLYFSLGRWITRNWGFYEGSRLSHYIRTQFEIYHPEDMAQFIIILYHRSLNRRPLQVQELVTAYHKKQEQEKQNRLEEGKIIHEETRQKARPSASAGF